MTLIADHIARRLGVTPEVASGLVDEFVAGLLDDLSTHGSARLRGLGTFAVSAGELHFEPEPRLAAVVNHRFAGLPPIPVDDDDTSLGLRSIPDIPIAAGVVDHAVSDFDSGDEPTAEPARDAEPLPDEEKEGTTVYYAPDEDDDLGVGDGEHMSAPWASTRDVVESVRHEVETELPVASDDEEDPDIRSEGPEERYGSGAEGDALWNRPKRFQEPEMPNHELDDDYLAETEFEREAEHEHDFGATLLRPSASASAPVPEDKGAAKARSPEGAEGAAPQSSGPTAEPQVEVRRSRVARTYWLVIPILVVLTALVLWLLRQSERTPQIREDAATEVEQPAPTPPEPEQSVAASSDVVPEEADQAAAGATARPWQPGSIDRNAGGYTIVVSSQASRAEAVAFARNLVPGIAAESLPVDVFRGTTDGRTRYRVGVGQYPSIPAAMTAMDELAGKLPSGAWILRIRRNM